MTEKRTAKVGIKMSEKMHADLLHAATKYATTKSQLMRLAVKKWLQERDNED